MHVVGGVQGAQSSIYAATAPELTGRNVLFIHDNKPLEPSVGEGGGRAPTHLSGLVTPSQGNAGASQALQASCVRCGHPFRWG
jgi:hypothetical protein